MLGDKFGGDLFPLMSGDQLKVGPHSEVDRVSQRIRDGIIIYGHHTDLLEELTILADILGAPQLVRECFSTRVLLQIGIIADSG